MSDEIQTVEQVLLHNELVVSVWRIVATTKIDAAYFKSTFLQFHNIGHQPVSWLVAKTGISYVIDKFLTTQVHPTDRRNEVVPLPSVRLYHEPDIIEKFHVSF